MSLVQINWNPPRRQLRQFGAICLVAFGLLGWLVYVKQSFLRISLTMQTAHAIGLSLAVFGIACAIAAMIAPSALRLVYVGLSLIGLPIGTAVSFCILAILFYGIITPIGWVMRLMGRDTMQRRLQPEAQTYWQAREPVADKKRYFRQS